MISTELCTFSWVQWYHMNFMNKILSVLNVDWCYRISLYINISWAYEIASSKDDPEEMNMCQDHLLLATIWTEMGTLSLIKLVRLWWVKACTFARQTADRQELGVLLTVSASSWDEPISTSASSQETSALPSVFSYTASASFPEGSMPTPVSASPTASKSVC